MKRKMDDEIDDDAMPTLVEIPSNVDNSVDKVVPVTILSGFLGSGKTTLLNYILTSNHGYRIAVIENEFSEGLGIEAMIAKSGVNGDNIENFFELNNGCICCTVKDDLLRTLEQLVLHKDRFDYILIETTGMANPGPVVTSFWTDKELGSCLSLDGVICVVDCMNINSYLASNDVSNEVLQQLCYADRILINKCDLVSSQQISEVKNAVASINCLASMQESTFGKVQLDFILNTNSYANQGSTFVQCMPCVDSNSSSHLQKPSAVESVALQLEGTFDLQKVRLLLDFLLYANGDAAPSGSGLPAEWIALLSSSMPGRKIYRMKGVLHIQDSALLYILQAVYNLFDLEPSEFSVGSADDKSNGKNLLVVIGVKLDSTVLQQLFNSCLIV